jgi:hypothetical protein
MGTSKAYEGPKWPGVNKAIGDAISSEDPDEKKLPIAIGKFTEAYKNYAFHDNFQANQDSEGRSGNRSSSNQTDSGGGSGGVARSRAAKSGARLARFLYAASSEGLDSALQEFDLSKLKDKPLNEFLDGLSEHFSEEGGLLDDYSINMAMSETLNELSGKSISVKDLDVLLSSGNVNIEETLQIFYANILAVNFEQKEYSYVRSKISRDKTKDFFSSARKIIKAIVRDELSKERDLANIDWNSQDGSHLADKINREVLEILIP